MMEPAEKKSKIFELYLYFLKLGTFGFGGPIALAESMERNLVGKMISHEEYKEGLALAQLAPGPLATQLAMYIGYVVNGLEGATVASFAFLLPSFLMVISLAWLYVSYGGLPWLQPVFYGIGAAVIGLIAKSSYRLSRKTLTHALLWGIAAVLAAATIITKEENILLFIAAGLLSVGVTISRDKANDEPPPAPMKKGKKAEHGALLIGISTLAMQAFSSSVLGGLFVYFLQASMVVFGSGLAIVPFLYGGVVTGHHWLTERQFLDAIAIAMITPGPVVITVAFIGYLIAGLGGAVVASLGIFLPVYIITVAAAPWFSKISKNARIKAFIEGVTAAAVGSLAGAVVVIATKSIIDIPTLLILAATLLLVFRTKVPEPFIIIAAGVAGVLVSAFAR